MEKHSKRFPGLGEVARVKQYQQLLRAVDPRGDGSTAAVGCALVYRAAVAACLVGDTGRPAVIICADEGEAHRFAADLKTFMGGGVYVLPQKDFTAAGVVAGSHEYEYEILNILSASAERRAMAVVTTPEAACRLTVPPEVLRQRTVVLRQGRSFPVGQLLENLVMAGYFSCEQVEAKGQFARRGGIVDIFPVNFEQPVRIDFFGDEIETIFLFDADTQRSQKKIKEAHIVPAAEVFEDAETLVSKLKKLAGTAAAKKNEAFLSRLEGDITALLEGRRINYDKYLNLVYPSSATVFDYLRDPLCIINEHSRVAESAEGFVKRQAAELEAALLDGHIIKGTDRFYLSEAEFFDRCRGGVIFETFQKTALSEAAQRLISFECRQSGAWGGLLSDLLETLADLSAGGYTVLVLAKSQRSAKALADDLVKEGFAVSLCAEEITAGAVNIAVGSLSAGFELPQVRFALIAGGQQRQSETAGQKKRPKNAYNSISELRVGGYVVHTGHGIGIYEGTFTITAGGATKDYLKIGYAGGDSLYLPVTQLDMLAKYVGPEDDGAVRVHRLGGSDWQRAKSKVKAAVKDMADELIKLYSEREQQQGHRFEPDTPWQAEFEERFEYDETDDQLKCVAEIKHDMELARPMDRLLCGDVGFGKTEVALRAVFKCVMGGMQAAIVAPTTILAWQHFETVRARMEGFGLKIGLLSRFVKPAEVKKTLAKLASGELDVVIGTHRVLQKDVVFSRLGLIVIDEEQRFGVADKEKLKKNYTAVDVLTLSATPIPRTMNMALTGLRDVSMLDEAPTDRHPVQTFVIEFDMRLLADAMRRELRRGGQVYWLHNRIEDISRVAARVSELLPGARVVAAHGRMDKNELSEIWRRMSEGEIDVLICTTIIEAGVDLPNVNTLVVEDADRMGLSQLHQIRGRVGRSARRAYAYLTFRPEKALSEVATKRLEAIREFTEFGAGYAIAVRDMEIRGAGNLLGAQQHGHLAAVGYDMYLKLMSEAVAEAKGQRPAAAHVSCLVDLPVNAYIPEEYIKNPGQRLDIYRKLAEAGGKKAQAQVLAEIKDRFGEPPEQVMVLLEVANLRNIAANLGISEVSGRGEGVYLYMSAAALSRERISKLSAVYRGRVFPNAKASRPHLFVRLEEGDRLEQVSELLSLLAEL